MTTSGSELAIAGATTVAPRDLDALLHADAETLGRLYAGATTPAVADLDGDLRGRMLALVAPPGWLFGWARLWARTPLFPWLGKSFRVDPASPHRGTGINRVFRDRTRWFRFETFIAPSRAGDFDAFQLDYDNDDNPFFIRAIKDEVRQLRPGLFLGQAYLKSKKRQRLVLYFGLERRA
ncbi:MAG TPA: hypothetical protein VKZ18_01500 [Polyangia bacterium]|nr:hypothetical protein [Polyangia bacterium]